MSKLVDTKKIGEGIKKLRIKRNLTQEFLASSVGYSTRSIRRIESQGTDSINVVNTFAEFFGVSALDILDGCLFFIKIVLHSLLFKITFQIKKHWQPSPYITYPNLLFTHVHARLSYKELLYNFWNGYLYRTTGRTRLPSNFQWA